MPVPKGTRFRFKGKGKNRVRLAFHNNKVIEVRKFPEKKGRRKK